MIRSLGTHSSNLMASIAKKKGKSVDSGNRKMLQPAVEVLIVNIELALLARIV